MKLLYPRPRKFPVWAKIKSDSQADRYSLKGNGISSTFDEGSILPYSNHIEMSGLGASAIISYIVDKNRHLDLYRLGVFPELRVNPNDTHSSLTHKFQGISLSKKETVESIYFDGILNFTGKIDDISINRSITASSDKKAVIEKITLTNNSSVGQTLYLYNKKSSQIIKKRYTPNGQDIELHTLVYCSGEQLTLKKNEIALKCGETVDVVISYGYDCLTEEQAYAQLEKRKNFLKENRERLIIETPDENINRLIELCKVRSCESIFQTKNGLMHCPGGGGFYAALWTNDQCEYANPYFAYLGYKKGIEQSYNCYDLFSKFADENKVIPSSIIACGDDIWHGAGDRGDNSMYLYGLTRFLLTVGDKEKAKAYLPYIDKAAKYVISQITEDDIVKSDSDELENRFESGKANLSTSSITYDAFLSLSYFYQEFNDNVKADEYKQCANRIKSGIEKYFGAKVDGYNTYKYCNEEKSLRAWICIPLTVGICDRKDDTVKALLSEHLCKNGYILTKSGVKTYWDRTTLYALKGIFCAGESDKALDLLESYTKQRLLGEHAPYPVEAFPEGNGAQLSGESALYIRIITEGVLGFRPVGFGKFVLKPNLPQKWENLIVRNFFVFGRYVTFTLKNDGKQLIIEVDNKSYTIKKGEEILVNLEK